tara:strand:- start:1969 stop:2133 length:165 start_codon:yes stop_codon:yes gene_type:complete
MELKVKMMELMDEIAKAQLTSPQLVELITAMDLRVDDIIWENKLHEVLDEPRKH